MDRLNIPLGSLVFTLLCGIHSRLALGITSSSGWNSSQNPTTSPTSLPPTVSRTSIETEWFHVLSSIGRTRKALHLSESGYLIKSAKNAKTEFYCQIDKYRRSGRCPTLFGLLFPTIGLTVRAF
ncbi:Cytochrome c biogenesis ccmB mitochondrial protein [Spatholobus suberectus]|nr:Cytochrome c biogenesis ccmB mitochondrial protein [Spatholobus suberectus]